MTSFIGGNCGAGVPRDQIASLFVGDLHPEVSEFLLHQTFSPFGPIQSVRVCRDRVTWRSLRYGYVNFVNVADAESATDTLMCQDLLGRPMRIMFSQRDSTLRTTGVGNIYIKGLASSIDGARLHDTFSRFGKILSCKVVCDANGSKGYGFVHFATFEAAEEAIKALDGMLLDDQLVSICHFKTFEERQVEPKVMAQDSGRHYPGVSLYVSNLPYSFSEQQLSRAFSPFGSIISAKLYECQVRDRIQLQGNRSLLRQKAKTTTKQEFDNHWGGQAKETVHGEGTADSSARPQRERWLWEGGGGGEGLGRPGESSGDQPRKPWHGLPHDGERRHHLGRVEPTTGETNPLGQRQTHFGRYADHPGTPEPTRGKKLTRQAEWWVTGTEYVTGPPLTPEGREEILGYSTDHSTDQSTGA
ncbi:polyadenylate-binding protein 1-like [Triplophysa rosa]|uniref:polyadenylate-binding protein 1-like n=1 Tax=Triplophysa rosa TaxID=992332 RepID=UPI002545E59B|nr:polyadenylate-binding protein 1-like [Triplophysa rosa]